jgi:hypothetical protein
MRTTGIPIYGLTPAPVCLGIALLLAHCLAARPLPPPYSLGDGAKSPENRQNLPVVTLHQFWQDGAGMNENEKQFSFTRAASNTSGRAKNQIPISSENKLFGPRLEAERRRGCGQFEKLY